MRGASSRVALAISASVVGCNVDAAPPSTGGVTFGDAGPSGRPTIDAAVSGEAGSGPALPGADAGGAPGKGGTTNAPRCDRALVVVGSDYSSTNLSIVGLDGVTRSASFVSSGAHTPGLGLALSGDVDVPRTAPASGRVVLLDRYGTNVVTWMDLASAHVLAQLPVGTGFNANPQDYLEVDATRAFVSRLSTNPGAGKQANDGGGDLLIIDTNRFAVVGRIALPEEDPALLPRPGSLAWVGGEVVVSLGRLSADFLTGGDGRLVGVSPATGAIAWTADFPGIKNCGGLTVSPSGTRGAIACASVLRARTYQATPAESDVVVLDLTVTPPKEVRRFGGGVKLNAGFLPQVAFASETRILAGTYGGIQTKGDTLVVLDASSGAIEALLESPTAFAYGGMRCSPGCGDVCLVADATADRVHRWHVEASGAFTALADVTVDTVVGLPPRNFGGL